MLCGTLGYSSPKIQLEIRSQNKQQWNCSHIFFTHLKVVDHYENPRNVGSLDKNSKKVGTGLVGAPACGDVMKLQVLTSCYKE